MTFNEAAKSVNNFSNSNFSTPSHFYSLGMTLLNDNALVLDNLKINFDGVNAIDTMDAPKLYNQNENLSLYKQNKNLSIEHRAIPVQSEVFQLQLIGHDRSNFKLSIDVDLPSNHKAILLNNYEGSTSVLTQGNNIVIFQVDPNIAGSFDINRFALSYELETLSIPSTDLKLYPNPSSNGEILISSPSFIGNDVTVIVFNLIGQEVLKKEFYDGTSDLLRLNTTQVAKGSYILQIDSKDVKVSKKIILK